MNDECDDVDDDEDGDGRLAWEGILGFIRTDQSYDTYPIGSFQALPQPYYSSNVYSFFSLWLCCLQEVSL